VAEKEIRELQCQILEAEMNERKYTALADFLLKSTEKVGSATIPFGVDAEQEGLLTNGHVRTAPEILRLYHLLYVTNGAIVPKC
jgi:hypothetical protein